MVVLANEVAVVVGGGVVVLLYYWGRRKNQIIDFLAVDKYFVLVLDVIIHVTVVTVVVWYALRLGEMMQVA